MTYPELAEAFGITAASAKRLTIRRRWPKRLGNDGRAKVAVPIEAIPSDVTSDVTSDDTGDATGDITSDDTSGVTRAVTAAITAAVTPLTAHIERLERELSAEKSRAESVPGLEAQIAALKAVTEAERARAEELKAERDEALRIALARRWRWPWSA
jgi:hypothetical protein